MGTSPRKQGVIIKHCKLLGSTELVFWGSHWNAVVHLYFLCLSLFVIGMHDT